MLAALMGVGLAAGCATKSPPTRADMHRQSGTLTNLTLTNAQKNACVLKNHGDGDRLPKGAD